MKKRSSKLKLPKKPTTVSEECARYRERFSEYVCEVELHLKQDPELRRRIETAMMASYINGVTQIHHIMGRSSVHPEADWFCNYVQVKKSSHDCGHDRSPKALEIASLIAKLMRHKDYLDKQAIGMEKPNTPENLLHWHPIALARISGSPTLAGRIEGILLPGVLGTVFEPMCHILLKELNP